MRLILLCFIFTLVPVAYSQGTVPTFRLNAGSNTYTLLGRDPGQASTTVIPTVLVPVTLSFDSKRIAGKPFVSDSSRDVASILRSPIFAASRMSTTGKMQYADGLLRATFPKAQNWHTLLGKPEVHPISIRVPVGSGYVLSSRRTGLSVTVVDIRFLQKQLFSRLPKHQEALFLVVTHNTSFYSDGDATECCSWGTHGIDSDSGNSFVLASYLHKAPSVVTDKDVQPLSEQLAEFINDPLHNPLSEARDQLSPGNHFPGWLRPSSMRPGDQGRCGGTGVASSYFLLEPTDMNPKNNFPASTPFVVQGDAAAFHLQNVALLPWYIGSSGDLGSTYSFPDSQILASPAVPCPQRGRRQTDEAEHPAAPRPSIAAAPVSQTINGHRLIGYWSGYGASGSIFPLREVSPQWDVIIVAFSTPDKNAPEGTMQFKTPAGLDTAQFKADIASLKAQGKKVMISLGGGGQNFTLADPKRVPNYVSSVSKIVSDYGFDGIDIDFEGPSLSIDPGDSDFRHPTTPSIVNLISALRQLHDHFGPDFMISLVPEGTQIPSGYPSYGGQFGSYLAITFAIRDILSFIDVQDYNTPPLEGLDGEIYQPGNVDYHAAVTELLLHGFAVGGNPAHFFPGLPANQAAVGFLTGDTTPEVVRDAINYIITGSAPVGTQYRLRRTAGYPDMIGAMFWTIDDDRRGNYNFSNLVGPTLHSFQAARKTGSSLDKQGKRQVTRPH